MLSRTTFAIFSVCLWAVLSQWSKVEVLFLTLAGSLGQAALRCLLTCSLFALVGHRNLLQPLMPTASLPGTTTFIFVLYKLNLCFILIDTFQDWREPNCIQKTGAQKKIVFLKLRWRQVREVGKKTQLRQQLKMCCIFIKKKKKTLNIQNHLLSQRKIIAVWFLVSYDKKKIIAW